MIIILICFFDSQKKNFFFHFVFFLKILFLFTIIICLITIFFSKKPFLLKLSFIQFVIKFSVLIIIYCYYQNSMCLNINWRKLCSFNAFWVLRFADVVLISWGINFAIWRIEGGFRRILCYSIWRMFLSSSSAH